MVALRDIARAVAPLKRRVMLMIGRAVLHAVNDAARMQEVQIVALEGEVLDRVERFQQYGFTGVPLPGAEAVLAALAGNRNHSVVLAVDDRRYRPTGWLGGEAGVYDDLGKFIRLRRDGTLEINAPRIVLNAGTRIELNAGTPGEDDGDIRVWAGHSYREDVAGYAKELHYQGGEVCLF